MIAVLLSTYNGDSFIGGLIRSLIESNLIEPFQLIIRDDGSSQNFIQLLNEFADQYSNITIINKNKGMNNIGIRNSYETLLRYGCFDYYFFCDQDDLWDCDKIKILSEFLRNKEFEFGRQEPLLVFSDMRIVDNNDNIVFNSFLGTNKFKDNDITKGLLRGFIPGCSMAFNKAARDIYFMAPSFRLHDTHMFLMAYIKGKIFYYPKALMSYRIHPDNTIGLRKKPNISILVKDLLKYFFNKKKYRDIVLNDYFEHAKCMQSSIENELRLSKKVFIKEEIERLGTLKRKIWYINHFKPFHQSLIEGFVQIILI